jgi:N-methylhydantoinase B
MADQILHKAIENGLSEILNRTRPMILRSLASLTLIDRRHVTCAITTTDGQVVTIDKAARLGIIRGVVHSVLGYFEGKLAEGDIILTNDPFSGGSHLQDATLLKPLFVDGRLVGYGVVQVPVADIGGNALGGYDPRALEIWAEGVRVTPIRLYRGGVLQKDALTMLTLNSRLPHLIEKDLEIMVGALESVESGVTALVAQHTHEGYSQALQDILANTEALVRAEIHKLSDGEWQSKSEPIHSCLEDGEFRVAVKLSVADGTISLDFSGSSASAKGFINSTAATTTAAAILPFSVLWASIPANEGLLRAFSFTIPEDSFLYAKLPTSVGWSPYQPSLAIGRVVSAVVQQAQAGQVPDKPLEDAFAPPQLRFAVTGCGRSGCPFPVLSR